MDVDHIRGDETDEAPQNLMYLCRACNARKAITQARNKIGIRTRQYNPHTFEIPTFAEFKRAAAVLLGVDAGNAGAATQTVYATPPEKRADYAERIERANPFKSDAQRKKFFAMADRGEISPATLRKFVRGNPAAPTFAQYAHGVSVHTRGAHDDGGRIIHATPPALRHKYALEIARSKQKRGTAGGRRGGEEVPF